MSTEKKIAMFCIIGIIVFLFGGYITLDWYLFFNGQSNAVHPEELYSRISKIASSLLVFILVWMIGKDSFDKKDVFRLRLIACGIIVGDLFFLFDKEIPGVILFGIAHFLYIVRNGKGALNYLKNKRSKKELIFDVAMAVILAASAVVFIYAVLFPQLGLSPLLLAVIGYIMILCVSLWTAWTVPRLGYFPKPNSYLVLIGITFFFFGDIAVGLGITSTGNMKIIAKYITWIFYAPGLVLPALSGYDFSKFVDGKTIEA